jgi:ABC-type lipoprotein release transport system permease subunit
VEAEEGWREQNKEELYNLHSSRIVIIIIIIIIIVVVIVAAACQI